MTVFGDRLQGDKVKWSHKRGPCYDRVSGLFRRNTRELTHFLPLPCEDTAKVAICKPGRGLSPRSTLILDFKPPELWAKKKKCLLFQSPRLWYFVMVAWAKRVSMFFPTLRSSVTLTTGLVGIICPLSQKGGQSPERWNNVCAYRHTGEWKIWTWACVVRRPVLFLSHVPAPQAFPLTATGMTYLAHPWVTAVFIPHGNELFSLRCNKITRKS